MPARGSCGEGPGQRLGGKIRSVCSYGLYFLCCCRGIGLFGAAVLVILFLAFFARCIYIAWFSRERYGALMVMGYVAMIFAHFFENIGMSIGLMPVTGIPLPFISYGPSSVITNFMAIGIILSISLRKQRPMFDY